MKFTRRTAMEVLGAGALSTAVEAPLPAAQVPPPPKEGPNTPKIAVGMGDAGLPVGGGRGRGAQSGANPPDPAAAPRRIKQLGVDHVLSGGPQVPWTEESLNAVIEPWKAMDIHVGNLMINLSPDIIYGRPGNKRDEDIEKIKQSIVAASRVGLPVVEYN